MADWHRDVTGFGDKWWHQGRYEGEVIAHVTGLDAECEGAGSAGIMCAVLSIWNHLLPTPKSGMFCLQVIIPHEFWTAQSTKPFDNPTDLQLCTTVQVS